MRKYLFLFFFVLITSSIIAQHQVYMIGNVDGPMLKERLQQLNSVIEKEDDPNKVTFLLLGDVGQKNKADKMMFTSFLKRTIKSGIGVYAVTGDLDWDNSGVNGLDSVSALKKGLNQKVGQKIFVPKKDCPGPFVKDIGDEIRIVAINSQWWLHPYRKILPTDSECKNIVKVQILDEINEAIETAGDRKVLLIAHHPIVSGGVFGGNSNLRGQLFPFSHSDPSNKTFLPIYGTFYHCYRQNVGLEQDFSSAAYKTYIHDIETLLFNHEDVIVCSSHEYDLQVLKMANNYQVISGSLLKKAQVNKLPITLYKSKKPGFSKLSFTTRGEAYSNMYVLNEITNEFELDEKIALHDESHHHSHTKPLEGRANNGMCIVQEGIIAGAYQASKFKKIFFGSLYRDTWTTPVDIPTLNLDTTFGGLKPDERGGGLQTVSLKFKDPFGRKYAFRSIDKTPVKALPVELRMKLLQNLTQDMTATQHPYGALFVSKLLDATPLYHGAPVLYIMQDSPVLGEYRKQFSGMFGMLEPKPTELDDKEKSFAHAHAHKVKGTLSMLKKLYDSPRYSIDTNQYVKARVFDLFIGDWDRHEDNWKWIGFKEGRKTNYKPYPKDRDHAFSRMNGLFYYLADREWAIPFRQNFDYKFSGIKSLTLKGSHLDRFLLSGLNRKDWEIASDALLEEMTDEVIDSANQAFPDSIRKVSGDEIVAKLKARKSGLKEAVSTYYNLLAKEVDVVGTNEREFFDVQRLASGDVRVKMYRYRKQKTLLLDRLFLHDETEEIRLYGLAERDSFYVAGGDKGGILVRIIGGDDVDIVNDQSTTRGMKKTIVYDYLDGVVLVQNGNTRLVLTEKMRLNEYDRYAHKYNTYLPLPLLVSNPDDGFGGGASVSLKQFGFGHKYYKALVNIRAFATTEGSTLLSVLGERNIGSSDFYVSGQIEYGDFFPFYSFYGVGNDTEFNQQIKDAGFNKARYTGVRFNAGLIYKFYQRSFVSIHGITELLGEGESDQSYFDLFPSRSLEAKDAAGAELKLDIDFRDSPAFTTKGIRFVSSHKTLFANKTPFGKTSVELSIYSTARLGIPITLGIKAGTERMYGSGIPYYHLASLGQSNHLRGYLQNRFSGKESNYINTDLRFHLGKSTSSFLPMYYGINLFADLGQIVDDDVFFEERWHKGYGGGIYLTPINKEYITLQMNIERSVERDALFKVGLGVLL